MAELQFEAPLASFETEEWNEFNDFQTAVNGDTNSADKGDNDSSEKCDSSSPDNFGVSETFSASLQDLVHSLDEKITNCFCNYDDKVEKFAPVQMRNKEELTSDCPTWWTITGQFGNILPIDWSKSYAKKLQEKALNLGERKEPVKQNLDLSDDEELAQALDFHSVEPEKQNLDLSDDEELAQAMDFHSMIISSHHHDDNDDRILTADEVIHELETMMEDSGTDRSESEDLEYPEMPSSPYSKMKEQLVQLPKYSVEELKGMSNTALNELLSDYEITIKELSETLVQELALRDELEYDKELKNQFISLLLTIQKKRRESNVDRKKRKSKNHPNNSVASPPTPSNNNPPLAENGASVKRRESNVDRKKRKSKNHPNNSVATPPTPSNNNPPLAENGASMKKRRESNVDRKKRKSKNHPNNSVASPPTPSNNNPPLAENGASVFLSTVIPYHPHQGPPTSEQLQIYIKILHAINDDSPTVPTLLTDYILKVLCPT